MKIFGVRMSQVGDIIVSLPILQKLCDIILEPYVYFSVAQKSQQIIPLLKNHPLINQIKITDEYEELGSTDYEILNQCDLVLPVRPPPPKQFDWYNHRSIIAETTRMAGFNEKFTENILPLLYINRDIPKIFIDKTISIWPFAGYGHGTSRSPDLNWWLKFTELLLNEGFNILQCGTDKEPNIVSNQNNKFKRITDASFDEQIYYSLGCNGVIGTDSGSMWTIGAYQSIPQINLITTWMPNHHSNHMAFAPLGTKAYNLLYNNGCETIEISKLINYIKNTFI
jgi:ADP-heptose:LPS heptosyltransferase